MIKFRLFILTLLGIFVCQSVFAQEVVVDAGLMRSNGKIFVVMAVVLTILFGLFAYLISIDKKITRLEKDQTNP